MTTPPETKQQQQARWKREQKARFEDRGLKRFAVWIPDTPEHRALLRDYAEQLTEEYDTAPQ